MASERKIAANRRNSRRSSGPRTAAGKTRVSRNALRHGLAALTHCRPAPSANLERLAHAICADDDDPLLKEQALIISECEFVLGAIQAQKLALIERLREESAIPMTKDKKGVILADERSLQSRLASDHLATICARALERYKDTLPEIELEELGPDGCYPGTFIPMRILLLDEFAEAEEAMYKAWSNRAQYLEQAAHLLEERDEPRCVQAALPDLVRLDRYERRAWSRQKRAIRTFMQIKRSHRPTSCLV